MQDMINRCTSCRRICSPNILLLIGLQFIERMQSSDRWFLQIETFYPLRLCERSQTSIHTVLGPPFDWPFNREIREDWQTVNHIRYLYA